LLGVGDHGFSAECRSAAWALPFFVRTCQPRITLIRRVLHAKDVRHLKLAGTKLRPPKYIDGCCCERTPNARATKDWLAWVSRR
jgi:hypothetical protein